VPAYAQINKIAAQTFGSGHQNILWDEIVNNKNITLSGNQITFAFTGVYSVTLGMRIGNTADDVWTGINIFHPSTNTIIARSYGTGNINGDPGPYHFSLLVNITQANSPYQLRLYRAGGTLVQATPDVQAGRAIVSTIFKIG
jgi:hypothetical protein